MEKGLYEKACDEMHANSKKDRKRRGWAILRREAAIGFCIWLGIAISILTG